MSLPGLVPGMPRIGSRFNTGPRIIFKGGDWPYDLAGGKMIAGACSRDPGNTGDIDVLRAGLLMGKISSVVNSLGAVGHYAPSFFGVTTNAEAVGSTSIQATAGAITELVRRVGATGTFKLIGPGSAGGVVVTETVTYSAASGTDITVTAIANNFIAGSLIAATDGSEDPLTMTAEMDGIKVTDVDNSTNLVVPFRYLPVGGTLISANLLPAWPSDTSLQEWIASRLSRASGGKFVMDHTY